MIPLAYIITELERGGAEVSLLRLVRGLQGTRYRPWVFSLAGRGPVGGMLEDAGAAVVPLRMPERPVAGFVELVGRLRAVRPPILHTFLFHANQVGRLAGRLAAVPHVISSVRVCEEDRPYRAAVDRLTHAWVEWETCVAEAVRAYTRRAAGVPARKLVVIRNGVETWNGTARPEGSARRRVLTIAHLRAQKGIDDLLRAIPEIRAAVPDAAFTVAGAGDVAGYREAARARGVADAVTFAGEVAEVAPWLAAADLLVLPSRWEGCPNAVLEAMSAGLPVVATDVGGTPELVLDGVTGRLVPPREPMALARAVIDVLRDPKAALAMGAAGRARAAAEFSVERMVREHLALYERCLS